MSDLYSEFLVKKEPTTKDAVIKYGMIILTAVAAAAGLMFSFVVLLAAVLFVPGLQIMFAAADLSLSQLTTLAAAAFLPTLAIQIHKILRESIY